MTNDIKSIRDQKIREKLKEDTLISAPTLDAYENYIYENNIRMNKYSSNQKIIIFILLIIIFISLSFNVKFMLDAKNTPSYSEEDLQKYMENVIIYSVTLNDSNTEDKAENKIENEINTQAIENTYSNEISTIENTIPENTTFVANVIKHNYFNDDNTDKFDNVNIESITSLIEAYSFIISRESENEAEKNTALLEFATHYFNTKNLQENSLTVSTKYTKTLENFNYLFDEALGITFDPNTPICSNYFTYNSASNSYLNGSTYSKLLKETNTATDLKIAKYENNEYTGTVYITRTLDDFSKEYKVIFKFTENSDYTYSKYKITSFEVEPVIKELDKSLRLFNTYDIDLDILNEALSKYITSNKKLTITPTYFNVSYITPLENSENSFEVSLDIAYQDGTLYESKAYTAIVEYENNFAKVKELNEK